MVSPTKIKEKSPDDVIEVVIHDQNAPKKCCKTKTQIPNKKVNLLIAKASKISREVQRRKLIQRQQSRRFLFLLLLSLTVVIATLVVTHYKFIKNIRKELVSIQMYSSTGYRTGKTYSYSNLEYEPTNTAAIRSDVEEAVPKLNDETSKVEAFSTPGPLDSSTDTGNVGDEQELMIASIYETLANGNGEEINSIISADADGKMDDEELRVHKHKMLEHMKIDVMFKIYAYVSAFFIFVIFLLVLEFFVIARMLFREKNLWTIFC